MFVRSLEKVGESGLIYTEPDVAQQRSSWPETMVGGWATPLKKYDFVSWDFLRNPIFICKNKIDGNQLPPTSHHNQTISSITMDHTITESSHGCNLRLKLFLPRGRRFLLGYLCLSQYNSSDFRGFGCELTWFLSEIHGFGHNF